MNKQKTNWTDSRIESPSSNHAASYLVAFLHETSFFLGFATWMPDQGYKSGSWVNARCTNGNPLGGDVLYWIEHPALPSVVSE